MNLHKSLSRALHSKDATRTTAASIYELLSFCAFFAQHSVFPLALRDHDPATAAANPELISSAVLRGILRVMRRVISAAPEITTGVRREHAAEAEAEEEEVEEEEAEEEETAAAKVAIVCVGALQIAAYICVCL